MFAKNGCRGFPYWLKEIPGIVFRTDNQPFKVSSMKLDLLPYMIGAMINVNIYTHLYNINRCLDLFFTFPITYFSQHIWTKDAACFLLLIPLVGTPSAGCNADFCDQDCQLNEGQRAHELARGPCHPSPGVRTGKYDLIS
jgi:hypothetical protein